MKVKVNIKLLIVLSLVVLISANILSYLTIFRGSVLIILLKNLLRLTSIRFNILQITAVIVYAFYAATFLLVLKEKNGSPFLKFLYIAITLISTVTILASLFYGFLESINYPNYVYAKYGVFLPSLQIYANFQLIIIGGWFAYLIVTNRQIYSLLRFKRFIEIMIIITVLLVSFHTISQLPVILLNDYRSYKFYLNQKPKERFENDVKGLKAKLDFVNQNTEKNSVIIHPPQSAEFPDIGNQVLIRYFLYPRILVTNSLAKEFLKNNNKMLKVYTIITIGNQNGKPLIFPNYKIKADYILIKFKDRPAIKLKQNLFEPSIIQDPASFEIGIIKNSK